jgi:hypothetical protein
MNGWIRRRTEPKVAWMDSDAAGRTRALTLSEWTSRLERFARTQDARMRDARVVWTES